MALMNSMLAQPIPVDDDEELGSHSPTELADEEAENDDDAHMLAGAVHPAPPEGTRKRGRGAARSAKEEPEEAADDGDMESPSKRALHANGSSSGDSPLTGKAMQAMLDAHLCRLQASLEDTFGNRLKNVEKHVSNLKGEQQSVKGRVKAVEKQNVDLKTMADVHARRIEEVTADLQQLRTEIKDGKVDGQPIPAKSTGNGVSLDPWAQYIHQHKETIAQGNVAVQGAKPASADDSLTEEERRTLVVGGWPQDTRRSVIEEESKTLLADSSICQLVDQAQVTVWGPRRSVGMLKFVPRAGEGEKELRNRMWGVVKAIRELKQIFPSAEATGDPKPAWGAFVKTREGRKRSQLVSQVRRVTMQLAMDTKTDQGQPFKPASVTPESYDCDWNNGTVWHGAYKLASSTHRRPAGGDFLVLPGGWVDVNALTAVTGATTAAVRAALELEL